MYSLVLDADLEIDLSIFKVEFEPPASSGNAWRDSLWSSLSRGERFYMRVCGFGLIVGSRDDWAPHGLIECGTIQKAWEWETSSWREIDKFNFVNVRMLGH